MVTSKRVRFAETVDVYVLRAPPSLSENNDVVLQMAHLFHSLLGRDDEDEDDYDPIPLQLEAQLASLGKAGKEQLEKFQEISIPFFECGTTAYGTDTASRNNNPNSEGSKAGPVQVVSLPTKSSKPHRKRGLRPAKMVPGRGTSEQRKMQLKLMEERLAESIFEKYAEFERVYNSAVSTSPNPVVIPQEPPATSPTTQFHYVSTVPPQNSLPTPSNDHAVSQLVETPTTTTTTTKKNPQFLSSAFCFFSNGTMNGLSTPTQEHGDLDTSEVLEPIDLTMVDSSSMFGDDTMDSSNTSINPSHLSDGRHNGVSTEKGTERTFVVQMISVDATSGEEGEQEDDDEEEEEVESSEGSGSHLRSDGSERDERSERVERENATVASEGEGREEVEMEEEAFGGAEREDPPERSQTKKMRAPDPPTNKRFGTNAEVDTDTIETTRVNVSKNRALDSPRNLTGTDPTIIGGATSSKTTEMSNSLQNSTGQKDSEQQRGVLAKHDEDPSVANRDAEFTRKRRNSFQNPFLLEEELRRYVEEHEKEFTTFRTEKSKSFQQNLRQRVERLRSLVKHDKDLVAANNKLEEISSEQSNSFQHTTRQDVEQRGSMEEKHDDNANDDFGNISKERSNSFQQSNIVHQNMEQRGSVTTTMMKRDDDAAVAEKIAEFSSKVRSSNHLARKGISARSDMGRHSFQLLQQRPTKYVPTSRGVNRSEEDMTTKRAYGSDTFSSPRLNRVRPRMRSNLTGGLRPRFRPASELIGTNLNSE